jgi:starvation-inducible outer membrane lipoprotein
MRRTPPQAAVAACALVFAFALAACGSSGHQYKNAARPPAPIVISAAIDDQQVSISPKRFGAGPITLLISNQSNATQQVTLETVDKPGAGPGTKAVETGPINPRETASVKAVVEPGTYSLHTAGDGVRPVKLTIGRSRPSAQNDLLQP